MSTTIDRAPESLGHDVPARGARATLSKVLLACGVLYALLYVVANDVIAATLYAGYSRMSQAVSELSATGAPTSTFLTVLVPISTALMLAFGIGVWKAAHGKRALRVTGALLVAHAVTMPVWLLFPMTSREEMVNRAAIPTNDLGHIVLTTVVVLGDRVWSRRIRQVVPAVLARHRRNGPGVRGADRHGVAQGSRRGPHSLDGAVRTHQHRGVAAVAGGAGRCPLARRRQPPHDGATSPLAPTGPGRPHGRFGDLEHEGVALLDRSSSAGSRLGGVWRPTDDRRYQPRRRCWAWVSMASQSGCSVQAGSATGCQLPAWLVSTRSRSGSST
jgi:hypothetical protein